MRKFFLVLAIAVVVLAGSFMVFNHVRAETSSSSPTLVVSPAFNVIHKNTNLVILGSGYKPGQDINILFYDDFGSIGALEEPVKVDERGNFVTSWTLGAYSKGILPEGATIIMTADENFNVLASAPVTFADTGKDYKKWPDWAKGAFPKPKPKATPTPKPEATPAVPAAPKPKS